MTTPVNNPQALELAASSEQILTLASSYTVTTAAQYEFAAGELKNIKASTKALEEMRKTATRPLDEAKAAIMDWFRPVGERYAQAEKMIKSAMLTYQQEEERKRAIAEAQAREEARKEQDRVNAEALAAADRALASGNKETADAIIAAVPDVKPAPVPVAVTKIKGISTRKVWKFRVVDKSKVPEEYKIVDETLLGKVARSSQGAISVPGVEFYSEDTLAAG